MNCAEVKELLSAYHDAEVSAEERSAITEHLCQCADCSAEQTSFAQLSDLVQCLDTPTPQRGWTRVAEQLNREPAGDPADRIARADRTGDRSWFRSGAWRPALGIAALLLVALGWFTVEAWFHSGKHKLLAADFGHYVDAFQRDPEAAQQMLVSKFDAEKVEFSEVAPRISYRPAAVDGLPGGYTLDSVYLLRMPCCNCLQTVCQRSDGSKIVIFEYGEEQPIAGQSSNGMSHCRGKNCCLVDINNKFAASWKRGQRLISLVGVRDQAEVKQLAATFD